MHLLIFSISQKSTAQMLVTLHKTRRGEHLFGQMDFWGKVLSTILTLITSAFQSRETDADDIIPFLCALAVAQWLIAD